MLGGHQSNLLPLWVHPNTLGHANSLQNASHPLDLGAVTDLNIINAGQPSVKGRFPLKPDRLLKATFTFPQPLDVASATSQSKLHVFTQVINDHRVRILPQVRQ